MNIWLWVYRAVQVIGIVASILTIASIGLTDWTQTEMLSVMLSFVIVIVCAVHLLRGLQK